MRWAFKRQFLYALGVLLVVALLGTGVWLVFFYHAPSCSDGVQNKDEVGVDCGGSCKKLCQAPRVSALWVRAVPVAQGVYHAVALVRNPETDAGTSALPYTFSLYDDKDILIAERRGTMRLEPNDIVPLFEANIITGNRIPARTFIDFGQSVWEKMVKSDNPIRIVSQSLDQDALTLSAHIENLTALSIVSTAVTALLYDVDGTLVNASQTTITDLPARAEKDIIFTWQLPFSKPVVRVEITPRVQ